MFNFSGTAKEILKEANKFAEAEAAKKIIKAKTIRKMSKDTFINVTLKEYPLLISASPGILKNDDTYIFIEGSKGKKLYKDTGTKIRNIYDNYIQGISSNGINYWINNITLWGKFLSKYKDVIKKTKMTNNYFNPEYIHNFYHLLALLKNGMVKDEGKFDIQLGKCFFSSRLVIIRNKDTDVFSIARIVYSQKLPSDYGNKSFLMSSPTNAKALGTLKPKEARYPVEVEFLSAYFLYKGGVIKGNVNKKHDSISPKDIIRGLFSPEVFDGYGTLSQWGASVNKKNIKSFKYLGACCSNKEIAKEIKEKEEFDNKYTIQDRDLKGPNQSHIDDPTPTEDKKAKGSKKKE